MQSHIFNDDVPMDLLDSVRPKQVCQSFKERRSGEIDAGWVPRAPVLR